MAKFVSADKSGMIKETIYYTQDDYFSNGLDQSDVNTIKNSPYADKIANVKLKRLESGSTTLDGYAGEQKLTNLNAKVVKGSGDVELIAGRKLAKSDNELAQRNVTIANDFAKKYYGSAHAAVNWCCKDGGRFINGNASASLVAIQHVPGYPNSFLSNGTIDDCNQG